MTADAGRSSSEEKPAIGAADQRFYGRECGQTMRPFALLIEKWAGLVRYGFAIPPHALILSAVCQDELFREGRSRTRGKADVKGSFHYSVVQAE